MKNLKDKTLLLLGDSIMNGSGNNSYGVGEYLVKDSGIQLVKLCRGGARVGYQKDKNWVVTQVRTAIDNKVNPDLIIFNGFTNDCQMTDEKNCDVALGEYSKNIKDVYDLGEGDAFTPCFQSCVEAMKKHFPKAKIIFVRPHKMGRRHAVHQVTYGERAVEICEANGVTVVDLYKDSGIDTFKEDDRDKYTADSYGWGRGDATHPNALCYEEVYMPLIEKAVEKVL